MILEITQGTEEWFKARLGLATASRFGHVLARLRDGSEAATRKNYRAQLVVERLTGIPAESYQNAAMQWGIETEPLAKIAYQVRMATPIKEVGFVQHDTLMAGASPDGLILDDGVLEIKCPNTATHIEYLKAGVVPNEYVPQVQGQIWATGRKWAHFASYDPRLPGNSQLFVVRADRDDAYIALLEQELQLFLSEVDADVKYLQEYSA